MYVHLHVCVYNITMRKVCFFLVFRAKKREVRSLGEQVELYTEAVAAKDHVVVELTNKVARSFGTIIISSVIH